MMPDKETRIDAFIAGDRVRCECALAMQELAREFAVCWTGPRRIALIGALGAGKTQFTKGLVAGLGIADDVTSPTFTLAHEYGNNGGRSAVVHFDWYRLDAVEQLDEVGLDDALAFDGWVVVEWADRFPGALPAPVVEIQITIDGDARQIRLEVTS